MTHYFEKTIVDAKTIYTDYLLNVLTPILYYGLKYIYKKSLEMEAEIIEGEKINPEVRNPGVLTIFQYYLADLNKWTSAMVEEEVNRIRSESGCADIFDDLIKAVVKSHIIVLTYTASKKTCKVILEKLHEKVEINGFVHCCYLECAKIFIDHPTLFFHDFTNHELKENERKIYQLIKIGIKNGIKRVLPMRKILTEYLNNDYLEVDEENPHDEYIKMKDLVRRDLYGQENEDQGGRMKLLDSDTSDNNLDKSKHNHDVGDIEALIFGRNIDDTFDVEIIDEPLQNQDQQTQLKDNTILNVVQNEGEIADVPMQEHAEADKIVEAVANNANPVNTESRINEMFGKASKKGGKGAKASSSILADAMKSLKQNDSQNKNNKDDDEINIVKSAVVNNVNENDNYFNDMAN